MYETKTGRYDEIPDGMKKYINNYGCHFNKKLCDEASMRMYYTDSNGEKHRRAYKKEQLEEVLAKNNIVLKRNKLYDAVYVANMCANDFLGKSVPDEPHLAMYVKDVIDDADAEEGYVFNAFYAKSIFNNEPIEWDEMI